MMPGAQAPLALESWLIGIEYGLEVPQSKLFIKPRRRVAIPRMVVVARQHVFMNWTVYNYLSSV